MQFCLLYIEKDLARLSCFESSLTQVKALDEAHSSLSLSWTDSLGLRLDSTSEDEAEEPKVHPNFILELLSRNSARITDPLLVCLGVSLAESYLLDFPFSDVKKIKQVINLELEDILPFDPDFSSTYISTQIYPNTKSGSTAKVLLIDKPLLQQIIGDIQVTGSIAPLFLYQPLVTESLLKRELRIHQDPLLALEYDVSDSYLFHSSADSSSLESRAIILPEQISALSDILSAHLNVLKQTEVKKLTVINKSEHDLSQQLAIKGMETRHIDPRQFLSNFNDYSSNSDQLLVSSILCALSIANELVGEDVLDDSNIKNLNFFNIREGEFKYRPPFSEFKENILSEIVPFSLTAIFLLFLVGLNLVSPIKELGLYESEARKLLASETPELSTQSGKPLDILSNEIINLENQIGGLTSMRSLSPFDWLYKISKGIREDIPLALESLSITSTGIVFRGTVPNYPSSGKLDSMLKTMMSNNPNIICKGEVNTEQGSSAQKVSITGILELCQ